MANQRISQFTYTSIITGDELIGVAINGQNKSISVGQILTYAANSDKIMQQDKTIDQLSKEMIQQEILVRETSEKLSALQQEVNDLYEQLGNNNDDIVSYINSVRESISSYLGLIQKNTNLISYFHADVMRLDSAISSVKHTLYDKNGMQDIQNQHTDQLIILHDELHNLENTVDQYNQDALWNIAYNREYIDNLSSYLSYNVYPVIDDLYSKSENLSTYTDELNQSIESLNAKVEQYNQNTLWNITYNRQYSDTIYSELDSSINTTYVDLTNKINIDITKLRTESEEKDRVLEDRINGHDNRLDAIEGHNIKQDETIAANREEYDERVSYVDSTIESLYSYLTCGSNDIIDELHATYTYLGNYINTAYNTVYSNLESTYAYALEYTTSTYNLLNDKIDSTYAYALDYTTNSYTSIYNSLKDSNTYALNYIKASYDSIYNDVVDNIDRIDQEISNLKAYDEENTSKLADVKKTADDGLKLAKTNTQAISKLESDYVIIDSRLDNLEADSIAVHETLQQQSAAIHELHEKVDVIENQTIPNVITSYENADAIINTRIDNIIELIGAASLDESNKLSYSDIDRIANTVLSRVLELEDETSHFAWHESHPETSLWGEFDVVTGCGYRGSSCSSKG